MPSTHYLRCLGEPALYDATGRSIRIRVRKHLALLVYLVVESRIRHSRDHLAELFWQHLGQAEARHSLATGLTSLRAAFRQNVFDSNAVGVRWDYRGLQTDLERLASGDLFASHVALPLDISAFLDGFELAGAPEFMLWREGQRARWLPAIRDALVAQIERCRRTGDTNALEQLADRLLVLDNLSEDGIRAKMEARAFAGDRVTSLKLYESWCSRLTHDLGATPSAYLEQMATRLRKRGWERSTERQVPAVRTDQWKGRPFVGRSKEYQQLYDCWERAKQGAPNHVCVVGESGVGKTTLVDRIATAAGLQGASVAKVQCYDLDRAIPYAAVAGIVRCLLDKPGAGAASPTALAALALIVPETRRRYPSLPPSPERLGEGTRLRLGEGLFELVSVVADEHPTILVVDDYHLADDASLAILQALVRRFSTESVLTILVSRTNEQSASPHGIRLRESLASIGVTTVDLAPMDDADATHLVTALCNSPDSEPSAAVRRALLNAGRGYPMALELLCQDWHLHGNRSLALSLEAMTPDVPSSALPAEAYACLYERMVRGLDGPTRSVLNLAAILGHRLADASMYSIVDLTLGQTMLGVSHLTELRILRDDGERVEFCNELIRTHAYLGVPSSLRRILHDCVADRLLASEGDDVKRLGLEIAWHCIRAGRTGEVGPYLLAGVARAIESGAPHEAELALRSGAALLVDDAEQFEGRLLLADALQEQSEWNASLEVLSQPSGAPNSRAEIALASLRCIANCNLYRYDDDLLVNEARKLQDYLGSIEEPNTLCRVARALSCLVLQGRNRELAKSVMRSLRKQSHVVSGSPERHAWALALLRVEYFSRPHSDIAPHLVNLSAEIAATSNRSSGAADVAIGRGNCCCSAGAYREALPYYESAAETANELSNRTLLASAAVNRSLCYGMLGDYSLQVNLAKLALSYEDDSAPSYRRLLARSNLASGWLMLGNKAEAAAVIQEVERMLVASGPQWVRQVRLLLLADLHWLAGSEKLALKWARDGTAGAYRRPLATCFTGIHGRWLARTTPEPGASMAYLRELLRTRSRLDQVDIAEIAVSIVELGGKTDLASDGDRARARVEIARLPEQFGRQMELLGFWTPSTPEATPGL